MGRRRIYVDTSVIGGCFDAKFAGDSLKLIESARIGACILLISAITRRELLMAPPAVSAILHGLPQGAVEELRVSPEALELADKYLAARVIGAGMLADAQHIAIATINDADVLVSWNFKHIVNLLRVKGYNAVNVREGYRSLEIRTPREVNLDADRTKY
ncbi:hypothetical protein [Longimicrobium sp.]|jgi:hypothetical protein|uniref:hypothetical protein n=1 Tax=Longimicrobium sp. TaxID=2029185 RepID=UPI002EDABB06